MACNVALRVQRKEGGYHAVAHDRGAPRNGISHFKEARTKQKGVENGKKRLANAVACLGTETGLANCHVLSLD